MASPELPFATWRLRHVPPSLDAEQIHTMIPLGANEKIIHSSLSPWHCSGRVEQVGTITWTCLPAYLQQAGSTVRLGIEEPSNVDSTAEWILGHHVEQGKVIADSDFFGLTPLNAVDPLREHVRWV